MYVCGSGYSISYENATPLMIRAQNLFVANKNYSNCIRSRTFKFLQLIEENLVCVS